MLCRGHFSTGVIITSRKLPRGSFLLKNNQFFFSWGVILLRRKMTPGHYSAEVIILLYTGTETYKVGYATRLRQ